MSKFPKAIVASAAVSLGMALSLPLAASAQSYETVVGAYAVTLHITLKTSLEKGDQLGCSAEVTDSSFGLTLAGGSGGAVYTEDASADASVSGSTATCVLKIPFSWLLPAQPRLDSLSGTYTATITRHTTEGAAPRVVRSSGSDIPAVVNGIPTGTSASTIDVTL
jgi:hypothetical protein